MSSTRSKSPETVVCLEEEVGLSTGRWCSLKLTVFKSPFCVSYHALFVAASTVYHTPYSNLEERFSLFKLINAKILLSQSCLKATTPSYCLLYRGIFW